MDVISRNFQVSVHVAKCALLEMGVSVNYSSD